MQGKRKETANFYRTRIALFQLATKQPPLNGDKAVLSEHASSALQNIVNNWWITISQKAWLQMFQFTWSNDEENDFLRMKHQMNENS
jgi:hypothetical protein